MRAVRIPQTSDSGALLTVEERAIAQSVLYAGLFEYPLTLAQLRQTLIACTLTASEITAILQRSRPLQELVECVDGYFVPAGRSALVVERRRREARSRLFLERHRRLLRLVCALPYVRMVALSGSIAHMNLEGNGDLDLFIVTRGRHVWSVAVATVVLAKLLRRRATVCANYVVSDGRLSFDDGDLFAASQIIHLKPLLGAAVYRRLLADNPFVASYYPNFHPAGNRAAAAGRVRDAGRIRTAIEWLGAGPAAAVEWMCRKAYRRYLIRRAPGWRSPDQVRLEDDCLKLHTQSHRRSIMQRFSDATTGLDEYREP